MPDGRLGRWRSPRAKNRFRELEDQLWSESHCVVPEPCDIPTPHGPTRVYHWPGNGEPIVLLHGVGLTSVIWASYARRLEGRDLYAVDIIGDVGRSEHVRALRSPGDLGVWLGDVLVGLGLERAHIVGHSLGGFVALQAAVNSPARIASLVLFDPGGIVALNMSGFLMWGLPILVGWWLPGPVRRRLSRRMRMPLLENQTAVRMVLRGQLGHVPPFAKPLPLTDEELRSIVVPVKVLAGEHTEMFNTVGLIERAEALLPTVDADIVAGAGHALTESHPDRCAALVAATGR